MALGIVGKKLGMSRIFNEAGDSVPVTVIEAPANYVVQRKTAQKDGYEAVQVTYGDSDRKVSRPLAGHYAAAGVDRGRGLQEFPVDVNSELSSGDRVAVNIFEIGQQVDVTGISRGKGFAGVVKRHNFRTQDASHGNSLSHRAPGSIGQCQTPGRVFKGKKMAGHMGAAQVTVQRLEVVRVDEESNLLILKGAVPGARNGDVIVRPSVKARAAGS